MNELEKRKFKLIEKSIVVLNEAIKAIDGFDMLTATEMYNIVLAAFESLQVSSEDYEEDNMIKTYLKELEQEHKKIIEIFEKGSFKRLSSIIKQGILEQYIGMRDYYKEKEFCIRNNIDINTGVYNEFKDMGLLDNIDQNSINEIQSYWEGHYKRKIDPSTALAFEEFTGKKDPRIISQVEFNQDIWPMLNDSNYFYFYEDKNVYDLLIEPGNAPQILLKRVNGQYFDYDNKTISRKEAFKIFFNVKEDLIIKESKSNDGISVEKIKYIGNGFFIKNKKIDLSGIEKIWGENILIQKVLKQHAIMAAPHKYSINTFRMITLRWNNKINYLMTCCRFGINKDIKDNGGDYTVRVGISDDGKFNDWGIDYKNNIYKEHPTTGFKFKDFEKIPNFDEYIAFVKKLHNRILHQDYVCWDIAMGVDGKPIFIEMNFRGPIWFYQFISGKPIFGEYTEDILEKAVERRKKQEEKRRVLIEDHTNKKVSVQELIDVGINADNIRIDRIGLTMK